MRILLAPDKFKDALSAPDVCAALATSVHESLPHAEAVACPLADGGEGTGPLLAGALQAEERSARVLDPLGRQRAAYWWYAPGRALAIVEMAEASGLALLSQPERNALRTTSFGTGQLLRAALDAGARHILLGVGGSATVDGGAGSLQALGWKLLDARGRALDSPACGEMLARIAAIEPPTQGPLAASRTRVNLEILCDVDNPLLGPRGAAPVFAPQKGASPETVAALTAGLAAWADVLARAASAAVGALPRSGAAGGLPAALVATLQAQLVPGFERVADLVQLDAKLRDCDLCLTGEGRLDEQSLGGKVVAGVARRARAAGVPVIALTGAVPNLPGHTLADLASALGVREVIVVTAPGLPLEQALAQTGKNLRSAAAVYLATWRSG